MPNSSDVSTWLSLSNTIVYYHNQNHAYLFKTSPVKTPKSHSDEYSEISSGMLEFFSVMFCVSTSFWFSKKKCSEKWLGGTDGQNTCDYSNSCIIVI